nr:uncharacterized protein LOC117858204 [Setaria viridis]
MRGAIPAAGDASAGEGHHLFVWRWRRSTTCPVRYLPPTRARRGRSCLRRWAAAASMKAPGAGVPVTGSEPTHLPSQRGIFTWGQQQPESNINDCSFSGGSSRSSTAGRDSIDSPLHWGSKFTSSVSSRLYYQIILQLWDLHQRGKEFTEVKMISQYLFPRIEWCAGDCIEQQIVLHHCGGFPTSGNYGQTDVGNGELWC